MDSKIIEIVHYLEVCHITLATYFVTRYKALWTSHSLKNKLSNLTCIGSLFKIQFGTCTKVVHSASIMSVLMIYRYIEKAKKDKDSVFVKVKTISKSICDITPLLSLSLFVCPIG